MKRAIVLSGGGSKGAYQIGVWKALRRLGISYDIVTGTSVGALNAALMVQKDYLKAVWLWYNMDFKLIFEDAIEANYDTKEGKNKIYKTYAQAILDGGMNVARLEHTVEKTLNVKKLYKSPIDFGIVTFRLKGLKPLELKKQDIPKEQLKDYLIASATCFPAFQKKKIGDSDYIDGGFYDNLPINLAIDMGATEVIAVDLEEIGRKRKVKNKEIPITYISPNNHIGSFLVFDKMMARRCMCFGYYDTMKVYGRLDGKQYTFRKGHLKRNYDTYFSAYIQNLQHCLHFKEKDWVVENWMKISSFRRFLVASDTKKTLEAWNHVIERLGKTFHLEECQIYDIRKWNKQLIQHYQLLEQNQIMEQELKKNHFKKWFHNESMIKYLCDLMIYHPKSYQKLIHLSLFFPIEFLQALYLKTIMGVSNEKVI